MVSVIVPVYNVEPYLKQCIDSIISQTYSYLEILLIDDGSTDRSGEICDSYRDQRIVVIHTENKGLSAARNLGIEKSHGEFLFFVDSDDWIDSEILEQAVSQIGLSDILCFSKFTGIHTGIEALHELINRNIDKAVWCKLYRRECFSAVRFPEGRVMEEVATVYKLLHNANSVKCVEIHGYHYRIRSGSITQTHNMANIIDCWLAYKERYDYCSKLVDSKTNINLLESCAESIVHAWGWRNENSLPDSPEWENMSKFSKTMFPYSIRKHFPLYIRGGLLFARFNSPVSFWLAYRINLMVQMFRKRSKC